MYMNKQLYNTHQDKTYKYRLFPQQDIDNYKRIIWWFV